MTLQVDSRRSLPSNVPVGGGDDVWIPACAGMTNLMMIFAITTQSPSTELRIKKSACWVNSYPYFYKVSRTE
jgi:hypothetical protein